MDATDFFLESIGLRFEIHNYNLICYYLYWLLFDIDLLIVI